MATLKQFYDYITSADPSAKGGKFEDVIRYGLEADPEAANELDPVELNAILGKGKTPIQIASGEQPLYKTLAQTAMETAKQPGAIAATAGLAAAPFTAGLSVPLAIGAQGAIAGVSEAGRQALAGDFNPEALGTETLKGATLQGIFSGGGVALGKARELVANSPRVLEKMANTIGALTNQKIKPNTILEAIQREGAAAKMPVLKAEKEAIKYAPAKSKISDLTATESKLAQAKGGEKLVSIQNKLRNARDLVGKEIAAVDNELSTIAKRAGQDSIDLTNTGAKIFDEYNAIKSNSLLSDITPVKELEKVIVNIGTQPTMPVETAIKTKRLISDIFLDFSKKGPMNVKDVDTISRAMGTIRADLDKLIKDKAKSLGYGKYEKVYKKFGNFANDYDTQLVPLLGSKDGAMAVENRFNSLASQVNAGDLRLDIVKAAKDLIPKTKVFKTTVDDLDDLTDYLVLKGIYTDVSGAPSSGVWGFARMFLSEPTKALAQIRGKKEFIKTRAGFMTPGAVGITNISNKKKNAQK